MSSAVASGHSNPVPCARDVPIQLRWGNRWTRWRSRNVWHCSMQASIQYWVSQKVRNDTWLLVQAVTNATKRQTISSRKLSKRRNRNRNAERVSSRHLFLYYACCARSVVRLFTRAQVWYHLRGGNQSVSGSYDLRWMERFRSNVRWRSLVARTIVERKITTGQFVCLLAMWVSWCLCVCVCVNMRINTNLPVRSRALGLWVCENIVSKVGRTATNVESILFATLLIN